MCAGYYFFMYVGYHFVNLLFFLLNFFDLTGQVAIVTGCSTGLGVQMAKALASQGAKIVPVARRQESFILLLQLFLHKYYGEYHPQDFDDK